MIPPVTRATSLDAAFVPEAQGAGRLAVSAVVCAAPALLRPVQRAFRTTSRPRRLLFALLAPLAAVVVALTGLVLYVNGGIFTYTIDDPYIHLVLARSIASDSATSTHSHPP